MKKILLILLLGTSVILLCTTVYARSEAFLDQNLSALGIKEDVTYKEFMTSLEDLTTALETFIKEAKALEDSCPETLSHDEREALIKKAEKINDDFEKKYYAFNDLIKFPPGLPKQIDGKWHLGYYISHRLSHTALRLGWKESLNTVIKETYEKDRLWSNDRRQSKINHEMLGYLKSLQKSFLKIDKEFKHKNDHERKEIFNNLLNTLPLYSGAKNPPEERPFIY